MSYNEEITEMEGSGGDQDDWERDQMKIKLFTLDETIFWGVDGNPPTVINTSAPVYYNDRRPCFRHSGKYDLVFERLIRNLVEYSEAMGRDEKADNSSNGSGIKTGNQENSAVETQSANKSTPSSSDSIDGEIVSTVSVSVHSANEDGVVAGSSVDSALEKEIDSLVVECNGNAAIHAEGNVEGGGTSGGATVNGDQSGSTQNESSADPDVSMVDVRNIECDNNKIDSSKDLGNSNIENTSESAGTGVNVNVNGTVVNKPMEQNNSVNRVDSNQTDCDISFSSNVGNLSERRIFRRGFSSNYAQKFDKQSHRQYSVVESTAMLEVSFSSVVSLSNHHPSITISDYAVSDSEHETECIQSVFLSHLSFSVPGKRVSAVPVEHMPEDTQSKQRDEEQSVLLKSVDRSEDQIVKVDATKRSKLEIFVNQNNTASNNRSNIAQGNQVSDGAKLSRTKSYSSLSSDQRSTDNLISSNSSEINGNDKNLLEQSQISSSQVLEVHSAPVVLARSLLNQAESSESAQNNNNNNNSNNNHNNSESQETTGLPTGGENSGTYEVQNGEEGRVDCPVSDSVPSPDTSGATDRTPTFEELLRKRIDDVCCSCPQQPHTNEDINSRLNRMVKPRVFECLVNNIRTVYRNLANNSAALTSAASTTAAAKSAASNAADSTSACAAAMSADDKPADSTSAAATSADSTSAAATSIESTSAVPELSITTSAESTSAAATSATATSADSTSAVPDLAATVPVVTTSAAVTSATAVSAAEHCAVSTVSDIVTASAVNITSLATAVIPADTFAATAAVNETVDCDNSTKSVENNSVNSDSKEASDISTGASVTKSDGSELDASGKASSELNSPNSPTGNCDTSKSSVNSNEMCNSCDTASNLMTVVNSSALESSADLKNIAEMELSSSPEVKQNSETSTYISVSVLNYSQDSNSQNNSISTGSADSDPAMSNADQPTTESSGYVSSVVLQLNSANETQNNNTVPEINPQNSMVPAAPSISVTSVARETRIPAAVVAAAVALVARARHRLNRRLLTPDVCSFLESAFTESLQYQDWRIARFLAMIVTLLQQIAVFINREGELKQLHQQHKQQQLLGTNEQLVANREQPSGRKHGRGNSHENQSPQSRAKYSYSTVEATDPYDLDEGFGLFD